MDEMDLCIQQVGDHVLLYHEIIQLKEEDFYHNHSFLKSLRQNKGLIMQLMCADKNIFYRSSLILSIHHDINALLLILNYSYYHEFSFILLVEVNMIHQVLYNNS